MPQVLGEFIQALRSAGVPVSPADTLDAFAAADVVGYEDKGLLKNSLALVLAKDPHEKEIYSETFDQFFSFERMQPPPGQPAAGEDEDGERSQPGLPGEGGGGGGGEGGGQQAGASQGSGQLAEMLLEGDANGLAVAMAQAARNERLNQIVLFTQTGMYMRRIMNAMGKEEVDAEIGRLDTAEQAGDEGAGRRAQALRQGLNWLREQVRDYVEHQLALDIAGNSKKFREDTLARLRLSNIEKRDFDRMRELVQRMAQRLVALHSRKRKVRQRGHLDMRKTMRRNQGYDGIPFELHWKAKKIDRPDVYAICDCSGSVASVARFLLMFLYSLNEVLPRVRSFAFSSDLGEVTELFRTKPIEEAIAITMNDYGMGSTNYGRALEQFCELCLDDIDNRSTIIILGDARNNYGDPKNELLHEIYDRSKRVLWLNPEGRSQWDTGDSEMRRYRPYCHTAEVCNSLIHLERVVSGLLRTAT
jgi:uncharacterized protein with von Willebrand factor type A (vWA) domain